MRTLLALLFAAGALAAPMLAQEGTVITQVGGQYSLAPGDLVRINVWGRDEYSGQFQVDEEGQLHYPVLGTIQTQGITVADLRDTLRIGLERLFTNPFVTVTPLFRVAVLGQIRNPGLYTVDPTLSVLDVVALAGGPASAANMDKLTVYRGGAATVMTLQDAVMGQTLQNMGVRSGDEIMIPRKFFAREDWVIVLQLMTLALTTATFIVTVSR
ncbi:MAG: polysaccharide export protein [Gemmatimonadota bacterium]|nr:MAG: polysaccharide export protein [Gemmatimonadota bacterium]